MIHVLLCFLMPPVESKNRNLSMSIYYLLSSLAVVIYRPVLSVFAVSSDTSKADKLPTKVMDPSAPTSSTQDKDQSLTGSRPLSDSQTSLKSVATDYDSSATLSADEGPSHSSHPELHPPVSASSTTTESSQPPGPPPPFHGPPPSTSTATSTSSQQSMPAHSLPGQTTPQGSQPPTSYPQPSNNIRHIPGPGARPPSAPAPGATPPAEATATKEKSHTSPACVRDLIHHAIERNLQLHNTKSE